MKGNEAIPYFCPGLTIMEYSRGPQDPLSYECWFYSPIRADLDKQEVLFKRKKVPRDAKLYDAVWKRDVARVKYLLGKGHEPSRCFCGPHNTFSYPLHCAVQSGDEVLLEVLLVAGAARDSHDGQGSSALLLAAMAGRRDMVQRLLAAGADVNAVNKDGNNVQMEVIKTHYNEEVLDTLLRAGADVNFHDLLGYTSLHVICNTRGNPVPLVRKLLAAGADVNVCDHQGNTVLMDAATKRPGQYSMRYNIPPDLANLTEVLLAAGADVNRQNRRGTTALHVACSNTDASLPVVKRLLAAGSDVNIVDIKGRTPLLVATGNGIRQVLLLAGADPDHESRTQETALLKAIKHHNVESVRLLVLANADVNWRASSGSLLYQQLVACFQALKRLQDKPGLWSDIVSGFQIVTILQLAGARVCSQKCRLLLLAVSRLLQNLHQLNSRFTVPIEEVHVALKAVQSALWLRQNPRSLAESCCFVIRDKLRPGFYMKLNNLAVPRPLRDSISMEYLQTKR